MCVRYLEQLDYIIVPYEIINTMLDKIVINFHPFFKLGLY